MSMKTLTLLILVLFAAVSEALGAQRPVLEPDERAKALLTSVPRAELEAELQKSSSTHFLYGGPGSLLGQFQDAGGAPDWQGWTSQDLSDVGVWQRSDFNASNLNGLGVANQAMWAGYDVGQEEWPSLPGYGDNWDVILEYTTTVVNPAVGQTVDLSFVYNFETEFNYDFLTVRYFVNGAWVEVFDISGTNAVGGIFGAPATYDSNVDGAAIVYNGLDYAGSGGDEILLQIRFVSDAAYSDQDGAFDTAAGAAQVDDISVTHLDGSSLEDFQSAGPYAWNHKPNLVGDFAKIRSGLPDLDECYENTSPQVTFIDDGTPPNNVPGQSTGGATSSWSYGLGGWVVNEEGGLTGDTSRLLQNVVISPPIPWRLDGSDDGSDWQTMVEYDIYYHGEFSPENAFDLRVSDDDGSTWSSWTSLHQFVYFFQPTIRYYRNRYDVTHLVPPSTTHVQIRLGNWDNSELGFQFEATPAPYFDNVLVCKERSGPIVSMDTFFRLRDEFPASDNYDVSTVVARDALDVPLGSSGTTIPGFVHEAQANVRLTDPNDILQPSEIKLVWVLDKNPLFEDAIRVAPAGTSTVPGGATNGWDQWTGEFTPTVTTGPVTQALFAMPSTDFFYPGDQFRYYVEAVSDGGETRTEPQDLSGFAAGQNYDPAFTVRALPTLDGSGQPPAILLDLSLYAPYHDSYRTILGQAGMGLGSEVDLFRLERVDLDEVMTPDHLAGYECMIVVGGSAFGDEATFLSDWHELPGDRFVIHTTTVNDTAYRTDVQGINDPGTQLTIAAPYVRAEHATFTDDLVATSQYCSGFPRYRIDEIEPVVGALVGHSLEDPENLGVPVAGAVGSVIHDRTDLEGDRIVDITFAIDLIRLQAPSNGNGTSGGALALRQALDFWGHPAGPITGYDEPELHDFDLSAYPNPFNPSTSIRMTLPVSGPARVDIYNLRGQRVRTVHEGSLPAGPHTFTWDGKDSMGAPVGSGIYLAEARSGKHTQSRKLTLVK